MNAKDKKPAVYWLVYFLFIWLLLEFGCRIILFRIFPENIPGFESSSGWRIAWLRNHSGHKNNPKALAAFLPPAAYDATKGWALRPGLKNYAWGGKFTTNSKGLRGEKEYAYGKDAARKRIIIIGDSYVMGAENNDDQIFPFFLSRMLPEYDILNFGVGGYGHDQMLIKLKEEAAGYHPDMVILLYLPDDNSRNLLEFRDYAKPRYIFKDDKLRLTNVPVPPPEEIIRQDYRHSYFLDLLGFILYRIKFNSGAMHGETTRITRAIIKEMGQACSQVKAQFVIAALDNDPENAKIIPSKINNGYVPCIFLNINGYPEKYFAGHWSPEGHRIVAQQIAEGLSKHGLLNREE
ncbi:MAG: SGNH/GDSL hydrolase family protein [Candidatus Omnitrophota bacterium]